MTADFFKYLIEQSSGIVIALILIIRVDRRLEDLTKSINKLSELIAGSTIKKHENKKVENLDTTNFQIDAEKNMILENESEKVGDQNIAAISEPIGFGEQAKINNNRV